MEFAYTIGEKNYTQKKLVFGQLRQLEAVVGNIAINTGMNIADLTRKLISGGTIAEAIAIVLIPEGTSLKSKDAKALAADIEFDLELETALQVVTDFFDCNPIPALVAAIGKAGEKITSKMKPANQTTSTESLPSLQPETLPSETKSSGDLTPENAPNT